ncbi:TIGR02234 family membrane protein [Streptacidiphilus cavernicola]|uniref:TIGR02234 family membrane protein n=1 Tax=Streptacidiphilus cavernicola TaxID=3342716 RepID=A0ABV6VSZ6_9ACTN
MTALPQPRTTADATAPATEPATPAAPRRGGMRSLAAMLLCSVAGATVVLVAAGQTWAHGSAAFQSSLLKVSATGSETSGLPGALALVGLASAVAVFAVRGPARKLLGLLLALAGAGTVASALASATATGALDERAARAIGLTRATATGVGHTGWPWAAALGGVLLLLAGLLVVARGRDWPGMSSRYDAPGAAGTPAPARRRAAAPGPETPADLWKAMDRGEDPTR